MFSSPFREPAVAKAMARHSTLKVFVFKPFGLWSGVVLPLPIPNRIVKHSSGDDSPAARRDENTSRPEDLRAKADYLISKERMDLIIDSQEKNYSSKI